MSQRKILLLGAGRMGGSMLTGWLSNSISASSITIIDPGLTKDRTPDGVTVHVSATDLPTDYQADVLIVAVKPQMMEQALGAVTSCLHEKSILISVAAGIPISRYQDIVGWNIPVVRCMPNLGAKIQLSATAASRTDNLSETDKNFAQSLLEAVGTVTWLNDEEQLHAATAIAGSASAYFFHMAECLIECGQQLGLTPEVAKNLALTTANGAGQLLAEKRDAEALRIQVTSPNGTTQAALEKLQGKQEALLSLMKEATTACSDRSKELANS